MIQFLNDTLIFKYEIVLLYIVFHGVNCLLIWLHPKINLLIFVFIFHLVIVMSQGYI